jgi:hypothetical protein
LLEFRSCSPKSTFCLKLCNELEKLTHFYLVLVSISENYQHKCKISNIIIMFFDKDVWFKQNWMNSFCNFHYQIYNIKFLIWLKLVDGWSIGFNGLKCVKVENIHLSREGTVEAVVQIFYAKMICIIFRIWKNNFLGAFIQIICFRLTVKQLANKFNLYAKNSQDI